MSFHSYQNESVYFLFLQFNKSAISASKMSQSCWKEEKVNAAMVKGFYVLF